MSMYGLYSILMNTKSFQIDSFSWQLFCVGMNQSLEKTTEMQQEAFSRVALLESQHEEREKEMENLLASSQGQRAKTVEAFEKLLASERAAKAEANQRAESLSLQIQNMQGQIDNLQGQLTAVRNHETALETRVRGFTDTPPNKSPMGPARSKRPFQDEGESSQFFL